MKISTTFLSILVLLCFCCSCVKTTGTAKDVTNKTENSIVENTPGKNTRDDEKVNALKQTILDAQPTPPKGFKWVFFQGLFFRVPVAWNTNIEKNQFCSSVESIPEEGRFQTGVIVEIYDNILKRTRVLASIKAMSFIEKLDDSKRSTKLELKTSKKYSVTTITYKYRYTPMFGQPAIIDQRVQYSDKYDFICKISFEAPEALYENYWENQGKVIMDKIGDVYTLRDSTDRIKATGSYW